MVHVEYANMVLHFWGIESDLTDIVKDTSEE